MLSEIKLAYYQKEDWDKLMRSIVDRESMHDTWEEWKQGYNKTKKGLKDMGFVVHDMPINVDALNQFCLEKGLKNEGKTRSKYVAQLPLPKNGKKK